MKSVRHLKIKELIQSGIVETQEELVDQLAASGFAVTQATISRDIKELQLVKTISPDGRAQYALPLEAKVNPHQKLKRSLIDHFLQIDAANNLVVLKCMPGTANVIGSLIDNMEWGEVMGTICGDDTILIIGRSEAASIEIIERIQQYMG